MEIGSKLKNARNEKGITQEQAAEFLGVSRQTISNWENNKSFPDIISVIKMSDFYSVSLDHLLKEEKDMSQNYQEFLKESTDTVKAKNNLGIIIILTAYFVIWIAMMILFWGYGSKMFEETEMIFKFVVLPVFLFVVCTIIAANGYFGKAKWFFMAVAAATFAFIPYTESIIVNQEEKANLMISYRSPNLRYMLIGIGVSLLGLIIGTVIRMIKSKKKANN